MNGGVILYLSAQTFGWEDDFRNGVKKCDVLQLLNQLELCLLQGFELKF